MANKMIKNTVLYIGNYEFPTGNAAGKRVLGNACALRDYGFRVISLGVSQKGVSSRYATTKEVYEGIEFYQAKYSDGKERLTVNKTFGEFISFIKEIGISNELNTIIMYGSLSIALWNVGVVKWCRANNIKVIGDYVDWLNPITKNIFFNIFKRIDIQIMMRYVSRITDGNIVISEYLRKHIKNKNIVVPPLCQHKYIPTKVANTVIYAGSPFRINVRNQNPFHFKDRIDKMIHIMYDLHSKGFEFLFAIYGFTKEELLAVVRANERKRLEEMLNDAGGKIQFFGRVSSDVTEAAVSKAQFTLLIRNHNRVSNAGFSTKIAEAISFGTLVLTNNTSDVASYIKDGKNGIIISDDVQIASKQIGDVFTSSQEGVAVSLPDTFLYKNYTRAIGDFIASC